MPSATVPAELKEMYYQYYQILIKFLLSSSACVTTEILNIPSCNRH